MVTLLRCERTRVNMTEPRNTSAENCGIGTDRLTAISEAVHARLDNESVLPWWAIQYALCEVGYRRIEPRELRAALGLLSNRPNPGHGLAHGPWEPLPGIYVRPSITRNNSKQHAAVTAATKEAQLLELATYQPGNRAVAIGQAIASAIDGFLTGEVDFDATEHLGGAALWSRGGARVESASEKSVTASTWITNDLTWVFPDDPRLWRHLVYCAESGQRPIVVARKIAISTFPLLKRLGAFGVQLHHLYLEDVGPKQALSGAPPLRTPAEAGQHVAVRKELIKQLKKAWEPDPTAKEGIRVGAELRLNLGEGGGVAGLREWLRRSSIDMPAPWKAQLTKYKRWGSPRS